jgi:hypothetical protein
MSAPRLNVLVTLCTLPRRLWPGHEHNYSGHVHSCLDSGCVILATPGFIRAVVIIFDIVALGWSYGILHWADSAENRWVWIAALFLFIGLFIGVIRGLKYLSEAEFTTRLGNIRKLGRYS